MSRLRIVAGELGGRWISVPPGREVRPTREQVREAWFSALGPGVAGARAADLFAGSGALGLEALSRGAGSVVFVESRGRIAEVLARNLRELGVEDRARVVRRDVGGYLRARAGEPPFDLALADPPYGSPWPGRLVEELHRSGFARLLCVEHAPGALRGAPGVAWEREYGETGLTFVRPADPAAEGVEEPAEGQAGKEGQGSPRDAGAETEKETETEKGPPRRSGPGTTAHDEGEGT